MARYPSSSRRSIKQKMEVDGEKARVFFCWRIGQKIKKENEPNMVKKSTFNLFHHRHRVHHEVFVVYSLQRGRERTGQVEPGVRGRN